MDTFETAVRYQFYHVVALIITAIIYKEFKFNIVKIAGWFFIAGIILFCGSLYVLAFKQGLVQPGFQWIGIITPFGGLSFITGWVLLFVSMCKGK